MTNPKAKSLAEDILSTGSLTPELARTFDKRVLAGQTDYTPVVINGHYIGYYTGDCRIDCGRNTLAPFIRHEITYKDFTPRDEYADILGYKSLTYPPTCDLILELETKRWILALGSKDDWVDGFVSDFN